MKFTNLAAVPAILNRTVVNETRLAAALVARITYRIEKDTLVRDEEQPWIVSAPPWDSPEGPMPSDEVLYRGGIDLFVFGKARAAKGRPTGCVAVRIRCRDFQCGILAIGDRVWAKKWGQLMATEPKPFVEMPLTIQNAYGGKVLWDGLEVPFPENPEGKGFCFEEKDAVDTALPNLEDPSQLIKKWDARPSPVGVGLCPPFFGPRVRESLVFSKEGMLTELRPTLFNAAFPGMVAPSVEPGDTITIEGVSFDGPLQVKMPPLPLKMRLTIGDTVVERPLRIDQVGVQVETGKAFITYRYPFRYEMNPRQLRVCELLAVEEGK
jgi:hypothetical protein